MYFLFKWEKSHFFDFDLEITLIESDAWKCLTFFYLFCTCWHGLWCKGLIFHTWVLLWQENMTFWYKTLIFLAWNQAHFSHNLITSIIVATMLFQFVYVTLKQNSHSATLIFLIFFQLYLFFGKKATYLYCLYSFYTVTGELFTFGIQNHPLYFEHLESCTFKKCRIFVMLMQFL